MQGIIAGILLSLSIITGANKVVGPEIGAQEIIKYYDFKALEKTTVRWDHCLFPNAWYNRTTNEVTLCVEMWDSIVEILGTEEAKKSMRFILAHELSHALVWQGNIPVAGGQEEAADELASIILIMEGHKADVLANAQFWYRLIDIYNPRDIHPETKHRGYTLECFVLGSEGKDGPSGDCTKRWSLAVLSWAKLLGVD